MPTPRNARLADQIQEIIARMLQRRVKDPRLGFVTITDVRLTPDNRDATVFYTVLGEEDGGLGTYSIIDLDLSRYDKIATRFRAGSTSSKNPSGTTAPVGLFG